MRKTWRSCAKSLGTVSRRNWKYERVSVIHNFEIEMGFYVEHQENISKKTLSERFRGKKMRSRSQR